MKIKKYYLSEKNNTRRKEEISSVKYIVVTSSKYIGFSSLKNRNMIENLKYQEDKEFSCHYIVDLNGNILSIIPEGECAICTRASKIDKNSISIMLCINNAGEYEEEELKSFRNLILKLMKKYNLKVEDILTEYEVNGTRYPSFFVDEPILLYTLIRE